MKTLHPIIEEDLSRILDRIGPLLEELRGQNLFITGGTGFFGHWILDSIAKANAELALDIRVTVLTRSISNFARLAPELMENDSFHFLEGDIQSFSYPEGVFPYVIHAATTRAEETFNGEDPLAKYDTVAQGTRHLLDFAVQAKTKTLLWTSSGALYGTQPQEMELIPETYMGSPDPMHPEAAALGLGKRIAEFQCAYYARKHNMEIKIARCFAFVGPRMQMDIHYAIGNFIMDAIAGGPIIVKGDGLALRSYMYITDLVEWLWHIFLRGESLRPYNVGSDEAISIGDLANLVARVAGIKSGVEIQGVRQDANQLNRYLPSIQLARDSLGLELRCSLETAIARTLEFEKSRSA